MSLFDDPKALYGPDLLRTLRRCFPEWPTKPGLVVNHGMPRDMAILASSPENVVVIKNLQPLPPPDTVTPEPATWRLCPDCGRGHFCTGV